MRGAATQAMSVHIVEDPERSSGNAPLGYGFHAQRTIAVC